MRQAAGECYKWPAPTFNQWVAGSSPARLNSIPSFLPRIPATITFKNYFVEVYVMGDTDTDLRIIRAALKLRHQLSEDEVELLEHSERMLSSNLLAELKKAVIRGDEEVSIILARAVCQKFDMGNVRVVDECLIYARVSTDKQALGSGLSRQIDVCKEWAHQKNYRVVAVFCEVASGAGDLPIRTTVERIAAKRKCKIICEDFDRWSRRGIEDLPPKNVEMASDSIRLMEEELAKVLSPFQYKLITGKVM